VGARSVAFPAVSARSDGWAVDEVADIAVDAVREWSASAGDAEPIEVRFVLFGPQAYAAFQRALRT
jgi:O-acetyl-ADP-ribose deacetylase (regulator of RNase III)